MGHHGRHRQVGQSRNRLAQRQEGNACCHRKHPEDGLDSRSVGHFAERVRRKNLDSSRKTRNNSTGTEHALKTGTIGQQSNNNQPTKEPTFPRTRKKKASKRLGWSRHLSLSFFCVPTLSLFTFPRT